MTITESQVQETATETPSADEEQLELITEDGSINPEALPVQDEQTLIAAFIAEWRADIRKIADRLNSEAQNREWCSEFDSIIENINSSIYFQLESRITEFMIEFSGIGVADATLTLSLDIPIHYNEAGRREFINHEVRRVFSDDSSYEDIQINDTNIDMIVNIDISTIN